MRSAALALLFLIAFPSIHEKSGQATSTREDILLQKNISAYAKSDTVNLNSRQNSRAQNTVIQGQW